MRRWSLISGLIGLVIVIWIGLRVVPLTRPATLEVSPHTTFLTGSLRPDETFNFEEALRQRLSVGITPENNAAVLLERACGLADMPFDLRLRYYRYLGMAEPLASAKCVVPQEKFAQQQTGSRTPTGEKFRILLEEMSAAQSRPWSRTEFPRVALWIDENDEPSRLIEQASRRREFYTPLVSSNGLLEAPYSLAQSLRTVSRLLVTRSMLRISEGNLDGAADDLLTCHRLAGLLGKNSTLIGALTAISMDAMASQADQFWLAQSPTVEQIERFQSELKKLPDITNIAATLDLHERVITLDSMQSFCMGALDARGARSTLRISRFDINPALRSVNQHYDSIKLVLQNKDLRTRQVALMKLVDEGKRRAKESTAPMRLAANFIWDSRATVTTSMTEVMLQLTTPAVAQAQSAEDRCRMRRKLLSVACALAMCRAKRGGYPETLDVLKPGFLKQLPLDHYNNRPLRYQVRPDGYILYSVGPNGKDDGGVPIKGDTGDLSFEVKHQAKPQ